VKADDDVKGDATDPDDNADPPAIVPIEDSIDLHGFNPRDIPSVVEGYLEAAAGRGFREVRLIHGRGKGVQRARVQELLCTSPYVAEFRDAPPTRGGWGATIVWLRTTS
jgi:DNA-nicking Smr family endonuclease